MLARLSGERPGRGQGYEYDDSRHRVAYRAVRDLVADRVVVDAGSGDGEGSVLLLETARRVVGLDHHAASVAASAERHRDRDDLAFRVADLAGPWPVEDADVVVAFQVVEHVEDDDAFVRHALGAVRPGGRVVITTPNRAMSFSENPHHVREYLADELRSLLERHADDVEIRGVFGNEKVTAFDERRRAEVERWLRLDPLRLRDRLPRRVVDMTFATLSTLVRRRASGAGGGEDDPITVDDFEVRHGDLGACLDFFAVVRSPG